MDKYHSIPFREEVAELFRRIPVMTGPQFIRSLNLISGYEGNQLSSLEYQYARNGLVLVSENGLVTTKFGIEKVAGFMPEVKRAGQIRVSELGIKPFFSECIDCYNLVLDLYPSSKGFRVSKDLFQISFVHEKRQLIYELVRIPRDKEDIYAAQLIKDTWRYEGKKNRLVREATRRIAVVESEASAAKVPFAGINLICVTDSSDPKGFRVIERRQDAWKDMQDVKEN